MKIDRNGLMRFVILTKNYAIKLPSKRFGTKWFLKGMVANYTEAEYSKKSVDLCPVVFKLPLGLCNIMKRARILTEEEYNTNEEYILNNTWFYGVERKSMSFGWLNDKIVAIDYGEV